MQTLRPTRGPRSRVAPATSAQATAVTPFTWIAGAFAAASLALVAVPFGGSLLPAGDGPRLAQTGAQIAPWIIGVVVVALVAGAIFLILGRKKQG